MPVLLAVPLGALVGVTGVGAFLIVPVMLMVGVDPATAIVAALAANLAAATGMVGVALRRNAVELRTFLQLCMGTAAGVGVGGALLGYVDDRVGTQIAAVLLALSGFAVIAQALRSGIVDYARRRSAVAIVLVGAFAQFTSIFAGVGGPAFTIPSLMAFGMRQALAIGTATAHGFVVSGIGLLTVLSVRGLDVVSLEALVPAAMLSGVATIVRVLSRPSSRRRWLEAAIGVLALLGALSAVTSSAT